MALSAVADQVRYVSVHDPRVEFAMTVSAMGSPKLSKQVYRPKTLDSQLNDAARRAIDDPRQLKIDPASKTVFLGRAIYRHRAEFISRFEKQSKTSRADIIRALSLYADENQRKQLEAAAGYRVSKILFDWSLNDSDGQPKTNLRGK
jgi:hypothetical protein